MVFGPTIGYDIENDNFDTKVPTPMVVRYLKGIYTNKERFINNFLNPYKEIVCMYDRPDRIINLDVLIKYYDIVKPFTYKEAFELTDDAFKALVFGSINVPEMIENLGHTRIKTEGKLVNHRIYKEDGSYVMKEYDVIYELHSVDCSKLGITDNAYVVKCWCTSTNKEHWLWVEEEYAKKGPLEAIASTIRVYENMIPHIDSLIRQGDVLLFQMKKEIKPRGNIIPLTADQYFGFLIAQS
jgi:hypothetical protein